MQVLAFQTDIASAVAETLGDPYSVLFTNEMKRVGSAGTAAHDPYGCVLRFYTYREQFRPVQHRELRSCHETITKMVPLYVDAWVNLAWLYLDEHRFDYNLPDTASEALERAASAARHAIALDPDNARAHLAMAIIEWFRPDPKAFDRHASTALFLNGNDPEVNAELGLRLALRDDWERALPLLDRAIDLAPIKRRPYRIAYALHEFDKGNYDSALEELARTGLVDHPAALLLKAAIFGLTDRYTESRAAWEPALQKVPRIRNDPRSWIVSRGISNTLADRLMAGLDAAGLLSDE
jgi:tetratricopeptide (TPR) repeat protein